MGIVIRDARERTKLFEADLSSSLDLDSVFSFTPSVMMDESFNPGSALPVEKPGSQSFEVGLVK